MSTAVRDLSVAAEPASEIIANALQALANPDDRPSWEELAALNHQLCRAIEKAQQQEAAYGVACEQLRDAERARLGLIDRLTAADDELLTHRAIEKALVRFIGDVDKASMVIADYMKPLIEQEKARRAD